MAPPTTPLWCTSASCARQSGGAATAVAARMQECNACGSGACGEGAWMQVMCDACLAAGRLAVAVRHGTLAQCSYKAPLLCRHATLAQCSYKAPLLCATPPWRSVPTRHACCAATRPMPWGTSHMQATPAVISPGTSPCCRASISHMHGAHHSQSTAIHSRPPVSYL